MDSSKGAEPSLLFGWYFGRFHFLLYLAIELDPLDLGSGRVRVSDQSLLRGFEEAVIADIDDEKISVHRVKSAGAIVAVGDEFERAVRLVGNSLGDVLQLLLALEARDGLEAVGGLLSSGSH